MSFIGAGFGFGWAKPTPVNPANLEGGHRGEAIVAAAGPISNLVLAIAVAIPLRYLEANPDLYFAVPPIVTTIMALFIYINLVLMIFNLIPIPPLDGSKVLFAFLSPRQTYQWRPVLEQYGFILLLIIVFFFPPGDSIGIRIMGPSLSSSSTSWWAGRVRQFRAHLQASVAQGERAELDGLAHSRPARPVRRHARRRPPSRPRRRRDPALRGRVGPARAARRPPARCREGSDRGLAAGRVRARSGVRAWVWRVAGGAAGVPRRARVAARHAETSASLAAAAGCAPRTVELIRHQDAPIDPEAGRLLQLADEAN